MSLLHTGVNRNDVETEEFEKRIESTNTVDGGEENDCSSGITEEEVVEVDVLFDSQPVVSVKSLHAS